jgi:hypothetical protein
VAIPIFSVGETKSRIVVIFEKRTGVRTVDGIYKADIDRKMYLFVHRTNQEGKLVLDSPIPYQDH